MKTTSKLKTTKDDLKYEQEHKNEGDRKIKVDLENEDDLKN